MAISFRNTVIGVLIFTFLVLATLQTTNITGNWSGDDGNSITDSPTASHQPLATWTQQGPQCEKPVHKFVFIKTHKTGSSTIATTLVRYADEKGLKLATPILTQIFHQVKPFNHQMVLSFGDMGKSDVLASHARFNKKEMDMVISHPRYITIIRNPVKQLESAYSYYSMAKHIGIETDGDHELQSFLQNPDDYFWNFNYFMKVQSWNGQIFDLGLEHEFHLNQTVVENKIRQIDIDFDLVMINEYFDESLVLLRKHFCWEWNDVIYVSKGVRKTKFRHNITQELEAKIKKWNSADIQLYDYFNRTFWQKVKQYGTEFEKDLFYFRDLRNNVSSACLDMNSYSKYDKRVEKHKLKSNAPKYCKNIVAEVMPYVNWMKFKYVCHRILLPFSVVCLIFGICTVLFWRCKNDRQNNQQYQLVTNLDDSM